MAGRLTARLCRLVTYEKAGVGVSDPIAHVATVEERVEKLRPVMDLSRRAPGVRPPGSGASGQAPGGLRLWRYSWFWRRSPRICTAM
jgi:hypothetical protein